ncbi:hypothetical protein [Neolewinella agarilytica]|uniref:Uncharacterized protein n=1 Tax=Neolewinella agarilytica TaxID=478744 RepID=A0A1H9MDU9_9BACT|nr:hypothetical protein [Neolewinella agarilytica]SER21812.1 hypothetical protein SAMN05444359_12868 [Neolewinella agarilytica]
MSDEKNFSSIASSYTPSDYSKARYAANTGDADLPIPSLSDCMNGHTKHSNG